MPASRRDFLASGAGLGLLSGWHRTIGRPDVNTARSPIATYPQLETLLRRAADRRVSTMSRGRSLELDASKGAFASNLAGQDVAVARGRTQSISADGLLCFAVDASEPQYVTGRLDLVPSDDLRPGLRATVLCDSTIIAAPMSAAPEWSLAAITDPLPPVTGVKPGRSIALASWLMPKGRHYITVAGPHLRDAGEFVSLTLKSADRPVESPLYRFALIGDTHVRFAGRHEWMNLKLGDVCAGEFAATLRDLAEEGIAFAMHGGDMTEYAMREEFAMFAGVLKSQRLQVYGCMGNHDVYLPTSRQDARELLVDHFPGGDLDYALSKPPIRFVVMDVEIEERAVREEKQDWLRRTLAADRETPTVFLFHYAPYNRGGLSSCGIRLEDWSSLGKDALLPILREAPNVFATLNGHDHWDEVNVVDGITHIQNAAFVEWPNSYRVFRVYVDRLEWEVRQVRNRGFVRESFLVPKAVSWMIATADSDLTGEVRLRLKE